MTKRLFDADVCLFFCVLLPVNNYYGSYCAGAEGKKREIAGIPVKKKLIYE
jgi:hypothetical protein